MDFHVSSVEDLSNVAAEILRVTGEKRVFLFYGSMGAGKTTFIKDLCKALGVNETVSSPTFSIVNEYDSDAGPVFHFDFYRLKEETEALDLGYEDYLYSGNYCFIEWPEKISSLLPGDAVNITITETGITERLISLK